MSGWQFPILTRIRSLFGGGTTSPTPPSPTPTPPTPVTTPPVLTVNGEEGTVTVPASAQAVVAATGLTPGGSVLLLSNPTAASQTGAAQTTLSASSSGGLAYNLGYGPASTYLAAVDVASGLVSNWVQVNPPPPPITAPPIATVNGSQGPVNVPAGTAQIIQGTGLTDNGMADLLYNPTGPTGTGAVSVPLQSTPSGTVQYTLPVGAPAGYYALGDVVSGLLSNWVQVRVPPTLTWSTAGGVLRVSVAGMAPGGTGTLYINPNGASARFAYIEAVTADADGNWSATLNPYLAMAGSSGGPANALNEYLSVEDATSGLQSAWVLVSSPGTALAITGIAYYPGEYGGYDPMVSGIPEGGAGVDLYSLVASAAGASTTLNDFSLLGNYDLLENSLSMVDLKPGTPTYFYMVNRANGIISPVFYWNGQTATTE